MQRGDRIGRFEVTRELGRGGMGAVVAGLDTTSGDEVAIKLLTEVEPAQRLRFQEEARALSRLRDPGLVAVLDADLGSSTPHLVMALVPGETIEARIRRGPLEPAEAVRVALELARTIRRLHAAGVVHRDLKPSNVILRPDGQPVIIDLGLALLLDREGRLTRSGDALGTPGYMAPEQVLGRTRDMGPATDVYGLGALLYALLVGRGPFQAKSIVSLLTAIANSPADPPSSARPGLDPRLDRLVLSCLAKEPRERPPLVDVLAELQRIHQRPANNPAATGRRSLALGLCGLALGGLAWWVAGSGGGDPPPAAAPEPERPAVAAAVAEVASAETTGALTSEALALVVQGNELVARGELEEALARYDQATVLDPECAKAFGQRSDLRMRMGDRDGAWTDCERVLQLEPMNAVAHLNRGQMRKGRGDAAGARADFDKAIELAPRLALAFIHRARLLEDLGEFDAARLDYNRAVEVDPGFLLAYQDRGGFRTRQGDRSGACADLTRVIEIDPTIADAWTARGCLRAMLGDPAGARADLDRALELDSNQVVALANRGTLRFKTGDRAGARMDFDAAVRLTPDDAILRATRAAVLTQTGDLAGAVADLERYLELVPTGPEARDVRAELERLRALAKR